MATIFLNLDSQSQFAWTFIVPLISSQHCFVCVHTVRKFSCWRYCFVLCDLIVHHFSIFLYLFDEPLRHIEVCKRIISQNHRNSKSAKPFLTFLTFSLWPLPRFITKTYVMEISLRNWNNSQNTCRLSSRDPGKEFSYPK